MVEQAIADARVNAQLNGKGPELRVSNRSWNGITVQTSSDSIHLSGLSHADFMCSYTQAFRVAVEFHTVPLSWTYPVSFPDPPLRKTRPHSVMWVS